MRNYLFKSSHHDYEEGYHLCIWEQDDKIFLKIKGHSVMIGDYSEHRKISQDEALAIMLEEAEYEDN